MMFGLEGLSPIGVWDVLEWLNAWWVWNWLSSRRLLLGKESLVWWLHALDTRWARNCDVPVGY